MHANNIELLRDEAQRLLRLNIEGLGQMMAAEGVITEVNEGSRQTFDRTSTPKYIEVLKGELTKLENMELVIAVVGTMKAGKSTTINAIVGTEVLPNRNRPMTALPTLIRHTPGQIEPVLKFENNEPINVLFTSIRQHIATGKVNDVLTNLSDDSDMKELIGNITSKQNFGQHYQGAASIFWCLKTLNDLVRLSSALGVEFPFSSYSNIGQIPVITVEFAHLREAGETHGQLTLLDTPGPNESGQDHLRDMLKEQLKKTSAVLAVFDYTQLKSDADEQVRNEIKSIAQLHKGRLFALVNKFDQKDRNGDGKEAVQALVADKLMDGLLDRKHVFPVSSKWGYLANRARHEVAIHHRLPNTEEASWVVDFAEEAFGRRWESKISDNEEVIKSANALWDDSGFHEPMENVIRAAHTKAALFSIDSAAEKLSQCFYDIENFLGIRLGSFSQDVNDLKKSISDLKKSINIFKKIESKTYQEVTDIFDALNNSITNGMNSANAAINHEVSEYFKHGRVLAKQEEVDRKCAERKQRADERSKTSAINDVLFKLFFDEFISGGLNQETKDFDSAKEIVCFSEKEKALGLIEKIQNAIIQALQTQYQILNASIDNDLKRFNARFEGSIEIIEEVIRDSNEELNDSGFKVRIKTPSTDGLKKTLNENEIVLSDKIDHKTKTETYTVKRSGGWNSFKNWLNDDWGREVRTREVDEFCVNIAQVNELVNMNIESAFKTYSEMMEGDILSPLRNEVGQFFEDLKQRIEHVSGDLQQGIRDKQHDQGSIEELINYLSQFSKGVEEVIKDAESLRSDIKYLNGGSLEK